MPLRRAGPLRVAAALMLGGCSRELSQCPLGGRALCGLSVVIGGLLIAGLKSQCPLGGRALCGHIIKWHWQRKWSLSQCPLGGRALCGLLTSWKGVKKTTRVSMPFRRAGPLRGDGQLLRRPPALRVSMPFRRAGPLREPPPEPTRFQLLTPLDPLTAPAAARGRRTCSAKVAVPTNFRQSFQALTEIAAPRGEAAEFEVSASGRIGCQRPAEGAAPDLRGAAPEDQANPYALSLYSGGRSRAPRRRGAVRRCARKASPPDEAARRTVAQPYLACLPAS
jgi:hypothetical protein